MGFGVQEAMGHAWPHLIPKRRVPPPLAGPPPKHRPELRQRARILSITVLRTSRLVQFFLVHFVQFGSNIHCSEASRPKSQLWSEKACSLQVLLDHVCVAELKNPKLLSKIIYNSKNKTSFYDLNLLTL